MWLCTPNSFLSIVHKEPCRPNELLVRGRRREHVLAVFPDAVVRESDGTDYRFRAIVSRDDVAMALVELAYGINYGNFKDQVKNRPLHDAFMGVWSVMAKLQPFGAYGSRRRQAAQRSMFDFDAHRDLDLRDDPEGAY